MLFCTSFLLLCLFQSTQNTLLCQPVEHKLHSLGTCDYHCPLTIAWHLMHRLYDPASLKLRTIWMKGSTPLSGGFTAITQLLDAYSQDVKCCLYSVDWGRLLLCLLLSSCMYMYVCICMYVCVYIYIYIYIYICSLTQLSNKQLLKDTLHEVKWSV